MGDVTVMGETMGFENLIVLLIVGAIAGWLAGQIVKGGGFGIAGNVAIGIVGAVIAGFLLPRLGITVGGGFLASVIQATLGAVVLLVLIRVIRKA